MNETRTKWIIHVDGDGFFAGCEVARDPRLRGRPVVTGKERGIASAMTYEAKRCGVTRGMPIGEIKQVCPDAVILPSDYELYSMYANRMYAIVRRYANAVEEYSIDECFALLTGSIDDAGNLLSAIKADLETELGVSFSVGMATSKVLSKIASNWDKPSGYTVITHENRTELLREVAISDVWGIGKRISLFLDATNVTTALHFAYRSYEWVATYMSKPYQEIHGELNGHYILPVTEDNAAKHYSIRKTKTFTPPSRDSSYVFAQLVKNIENACIKSRRHGLCTDTITMFLKTQEFTYNTIEITLPDPVDTPIPIVHRVRERWNELFMTGILYRGSGIVLCDLRTDVGQQKLFGTEEHEKDYTPLYKSIDTISKKYGKHTVFLGSSFAVHTMKNERQSLGRGVRQDDKKKLQTRKRIDIPHFGEVF